MKGIVFELWEVLPMWAKVTLCCSFLGLVFLLGACAQLRKNYPQDNIVEEIVEELIESKTGMDLDISPFSPEN